MEPVFLSCIYSETNDSIIQHFHSVYELIYIAEGTALFTICGSCYEASEGSLLFISKFEEHNAVILKYPYRRFFIQLTPLQLERCVSDPQLRSVFINRTGNFRHCFGLLSSAEEANALLQSMINEFQNPGPFCQERQFCLLTLLLILCRRQCPEQFPSLSGSPPAAVSQVQKYIDLHFAEPLSLEDLAQRFFISPSHLSHEFRKWTGYSPKHYIVLSRLSNARRLLLTSDASVGDIAVRCGFHDVNNFIRAFRQETGATPAVYRKQKK